MRTVGWSIGIIIRTALETKRVVTNDAPKLCSHGFSQWRVPLVVGTNEGSLCELRGRSLSAEALAGGLAKA